MDGREPTNEQERRAKQAFGNGQTTDWVGRTVAHLLLDDDIQSKAGRVIWCHDVSINATNSVRISLVRNLRV